MDRTLPDGVIDELAVHQISPQMLIMVLREQFGLVGALSPVPAGEQSIGIRLDAADEVSWFVKIEPDSPDEAAERIAARIRLAAETGVPAVVAARTRNGATRVRSGVAVITVWPWVEGRHLSAPVSQGQAVAIGDALGRLHSAFAALHPPPELVTAAEEPWLRWNPEDYRSKIAQTRHRITRRVDDGVADDFDWAALEALDERIGWMSRIGAALASFPPLRRQLGHGDVAGPNLLFGGDRLVALLDFANTGPTLVPYELGRIAYSPELVLSPDGIGLSERLIDAYLDANPSARQIDLDAARGCAFIQYARSLYPLQGRYRGEGRFRANLDDYWQRRQATARILHATLA